MTAIRSWGGCCLLSSSRWRAPSSPGPPNASSCPAVPHHAASWPTFPWQPSKGMIQGHPMPRVPSLCLLPPYLYCIPTCSPGTHAPCQAPGLECFGQELPVVHKPALLCHPGLSLACVFSSFKFFSGSSSPFPSTSP